MCCRQAHLPDLVSECVAWSYIHAACVHVCSRAKSSNTATNTRARNNQHTRKQQGKPAQQQDASWLTDIYTRRVPLQCCAPQLRTEVGPSTAVGVSVFLRSQAARLPSMHPDTAMLPTTSTHVIMCSCEVPVPPGGTPSVATAPRAARTSHTLTVLSHAPAACVRVCTQSRD